MTVDPVLVVVLIIIASLTALIVASYILAARRRKQNAARLDALKQDATAFVNRCTTDGRFPPVNTNLILKGDEVAVLGEASILYEARAYRVSGGAGTRVGGVWVGGGVSESHQRLKQIDTGRLTLTTSRLVFDGSLENRTVRLADVASVEPWSDAIEVSSEKRAKSLVFNVANPFVWTLLIQHFAAASVQKR